jgi:mono/diheme cytochrome c family protein
LGKPKEVEMMRIAGMVLVSVVAAAAIVLAASGDQMTAGSVFDGAYTYHRSCAGCHGTSGEGVTLFGPPLTGDAFVTASDANAIGYVINMGRKYRDKMYPAYCGMPKFQFVTGGELQALIDFLKGPLQESAKQATSGS